MRLYKCLKLVLAFNLLANVNSSAQDSLKIAQKNDIITSYSGFLKDIHLDSLIKVQDLSFKKEFSQKGNQGLVTLKNVTSLTLTPDSSINTPFKFADAWNKAVERYEPAGNIYKLLFAKLADYTLLPPEKLVINLSINKSPAISFMVYYDKKIMVNELSIGSRNPAENLGPGDLDDNTVGGFFSYVYKTPDLDVKLIKGLSAFFAKHKHKKEIEVEQKSWGNGMLHFKVSNVEGEIAPRLHEIITLNIFFTPAADRDHINVAFLFAVLCAGGAFQAPTAMDEYKDEQSIYKTEVSSYGIRLKQELRLILNAK